MQIFCSLEKLKVGIFTAVLSSFLSKSVKKQDVIGSHRASCEVLRPAMLVWWKQNWQKRPVFCSDFSLFFFGFFRRFCPCFLTCFSLEKIDFLICSKKNGVFLCKNERFENQALTKAIFLIENALKKSVLFAEKFAFSSEKSSFFFSK